MPYRLCLLLIGLALVPLRAQDEPVHMTPEFALIFPLTQNGNDVTVKYPVLINPDTIIKPGMVLRTLYVLSLDSQNAATDLVIAHKGDADQAYARAPAGHDNHPTLPAGLAHEIEGYRRTVWQVPNNFVLAMAQYPTDQMHLIYATGVKESAFSAVVNGDDNIKDETFSFIDGLFVGLPDGKVTIVAVEKGSKAAKAGLKAGDQIVSVGGTATQDSLTVFSTAYAAAKKAATENEVASYPMSIRPGGAGDAHQVNIPMPPSLKGGLMDGFNEGPAPVVTMPKPATPTKP